MKSLLIGTKDGLRSLSPVSEVQWRDREISWIGKDPTGIWVILDGQEIWLRPQSGIWQLVASSSQHSLHCLMWTSSRILVGTSGAKVLTLHQNELRDLHSFQLSETRKTWFTPWGGLPAVRSMSLGENGTIYVNVHVGGILRSDDRCESWRATIEIESDVHQVMWTPMARILLAATARGLATSIDQGKSWTYHQKGLHGSYLRAVAVAAKWVLTTVSTGPFSQHAALYRKPLTEDESFQKCQGGLPTWFSNNIDTYCLGAREVEVVFGTSDGQVFASCDAGATWKRIAQGLPPIRCVLLS